MSRPLAGAVGVAATCAVALSLALAAEPSSAASSAAAPAVGLAAFPDCQGWGCETPGGRGGELLFVTSLADDGPGSLREALTTPGPRVVLFRVSGVIRLKSPIFVGGEPGRGAGEEHSYLTVAGRSAPGEGVTIADYGIILVNDVHDVVLRHLRFRNARRTVEPDRMRRGEAGRGGRPGVRERGDRRRGTRPPERADRPPRSERRRGGPPPAATRDAGPGSAAGRSGEGRSGEGRSGEGRSTGDGVDMLGSRRVVIDRCSFSWATDENVSAERFVNTDITVSRSIIAEVLSEGGHEAGNPETGDHSRGMNFSRGADRISVHHNLFMSNNRRNPHLVGCAGGARRCRPEWAEHPAFDVRCNLVYNWGEEAFHAAAGPRANVVDNLFLRGPDTPRGVPPIAIEDREPSWDTRLHVAGNLDSALGHDQAALVRSRPGVDPVLVPEPFPAPPVEACVAAGLEAAAAEWGAGQADPVDRRLLAELAEREGNLGARGRTHDTPLPTVATAAAEPDRDGDGMPDAWESRWGLDPEVAAPWADADGDGWSDLEEYLEGTPPAGSPSAR